MANKVLVSTSSIFSPKSVSPYTGTGRSHLYVVINRQDSEASHDIITSMLKLLSMYISYLIKGLLFLI